MVLFCAEHGSHLVNIDMQLPIAMSRRTVTWIYTLIGTGSVGRRSYTQIINTVISSN